MAIIASAKNSNFEPVSEGVHIAVCVSVIDIGDQYSAMYDITRRKVILVWEIPDETILVEGEAKPRVISKEYTNSISEKSNLCKDLEAWRGKKFTEQERSGFDLINVLGKSCQLQVIHNEKGYAGISGIMALPKGMPKANPVAGLIYFDLTDKASLDLLHNIPEWIQEKIKQSKQYQILASSNVDKNASDQQTENPEDADLPF